MSGCSLNSPSNSRMVRRTLRMRDMDAPKAAKTSPAITFSIES
jgi:hypothetical protein